jgi:hypothetical protein
VGEGEHGVEVVVLDADRGGGEVLERRVMERVAPRLVVRDVAVLAPAAQRDVDGRRGDRVAHGGDRLRREPEALRLRHVQAGGDAAVEVPLHERAEVVGVPGGERTSLPVEAFVHVEDGEPRERDFPRVHDRRPGRVPGARAAGHDRARGKAARVVGLDECRELVGHGLAHLARVGDEAEGHAQAGMSRQLLGRDPAPLVEIACADVVAHVCGRIANKDKQT